MNEQLKANYEWWNEAALLHAESEYYDVEGLLKGKSTLRAVELEKLGDVRGKKLLHLQCHFGMDTLSLARLGAKVTGVDFADEAIRLAKSLNAKLGLDAEFVCSNIYDLPQHLSGQYDIVYTSYGVLCWLNDLQRWAEIAAHFLKPGGTFLVVEGHPLADLFELTDRELRIAGSYFYDETPYIETEDGTYAVPDANKKYKTTHEWSHSISEIMQALWSAGLNVTSFEEYPYCFYEKFPGLMKENEDGWWEFHDENRRLPMMFSLTAAKEEAECI